MTDAAKSHQRKVRERMEVEEREGLLGAWWEKIDLSNPVVKRVDYGIAREIIEKYEWLGTMPTFCTHYFGLYFNDICGGIVVFGISLPKNALDSICGKAYGKSVRVLSRGACVHWTPPGSASRLISAALKLLSKEGYKIVVAYCDTRAGEIGTIYQACNFIYTGTSQGGYEYFISGKWRTGKGAANYSHQKRILSDYPKRVRSIKHRYIYFLGNRFDRKMLLKSLRYPILSYPKRCEAGINGDTLDIPVKRDEFDPHASLQTNTRK